MDPLSITASVASLVGGVTSTVMGCRKLIGAYQGAPQTLFSLQNEARVVQMNLTYVQLVLTQDADKLEPLLAQNSLLAETFDISLTGCSVIFTDLSRELGELPQPQVGASVPWTDRVKSVWNEQVMKGILERLRGLSSALQSLQMIIQTEKLSRIEDLLRQHPPQLESLRRDVESAASTRMDNRSELARRNSQRISIVASTLGSQEFSFDDILVNSSVYRKQYNAWRSRPQVNPRSHLSNHSPSRPFSFLLEEDPSGNHLDGASEWLIDFSDDPPASSSALPERLIDFSDNRPVASSVLTERAGQGYLGELNNEFSSIPELDSIPVGLHNHSASAKRFDKPSASSLTETGAEVCEFCNDVHTVLCFRPRLGRLLNLKLLSKIVPAHSSFTYGGVLRWQFSEFSRFAAVGAAMRAENAAWSFMQPIDRMDIRSTNIVLIESTETTARALSYSLLPLDTDFEREGIGFMAQSWKDWSLTSWVAHTALGNNRHCNITFNVRAIKPSSTSSEQDITANQQALAEANLIIVSATTDQMRSRGYVQAVLLPELRRISRLKVPIILLGVGADSGFRLEALKLPEPISIQESFHVDALVRVNKGSKGNISKREAADLWHTSAVFAMATSGKSRGDISMNHDGDAHWGCLDYSMRCDLCNSTSSLCELSLDCRLDCHFCEHKYKLGSTPGDQEDEPQVANIAGHRTRRRSWTYPLEYHGLVELA